MGFRRGFLLGFFVGAIGVVTGRRAQREVETPGTQAHTDFKQLWDEARESARRESEETEARLRRRFEEARRTGKLPSDD